MIITFLGSVALGSHSHGCWWLGVGRAENRAFKTAAAAMPSFITPPSPRCTQWCIFIYLYEVL